MEQLGQLAANLFLVASVVGIVILGSQMPSERASTSELDYNPEFRPVAFAAEEIFLPRSLLAMAEDEILRGILVDRDADRLDQFLDANDLRDAWFIIRYRGIGPDGSTWRGRDANFECKRYHAHSSAMEEVENRPRNLEILARVLARSAGRETDGIVAIGQAKGTIMSILRFNDARIIPIPDEAAGLENIRKHDMDAWRDRAERETGGHEARGVTAKRG